MIPFIKVDEMIPVCCSRYYYYLKHSLKCQRVNGFTEDQDIKYAELPQTPPDK